MSETKRIKTALVSVYHKDGLDEIITKLHEEGVKFLSTGGTRQFIESLGYPCDAVEDLTSYPSILGGRVKTLHPKVFGGILCRRNLEEDIQQIEQYEIPEIDLVIVDLYPFENTVASGAEEPAIIEKIDIGGISLIRAGAKNFKDVVIVASKAQYQPLADILNDHAPLVCQGGIRGVITLRFSHLQLLRWRERFSLPRCSRMSEVSSLRREPPSARCLLRRFRSNVRSNSWKGNFIQQFARYQCCR